jgi:acetate CoA/acetoacetate CoA-transferase beta subunit
VRPRVDHDPGDQEGNLANWTVPGKMVTGMGGAMDLVTGAKRVVVAMEHTLKDGTAKILKRCSLPLTGAGVVNLIVTDLAVIEVTGFGLVRREIAEGHDVEAIQRATEADLRVDDDLATF